MVHGAWHGAWCWRMVIELLEAARGTHPVGKLVAPDLPGHGRLSDREIRRITLDHYLDAVTTPVQVDRLEGVVLVGHGFAATYLGRVVEELGDRVKRVVLISGLLPPEGTTVYKALPLSHRLMVRVFKPQEKGVRYPDFLFKRMLCNSMNGTLGDELLSQLVPDPFMPWQTPISYQGYRDGPRVTYVLLTQDRAITPKLQRQSLQIITTIAGPPEVIELDAGHEAPLTHPQQVDEILLGYAEAPPTPGESEASEVER